jgi:hypothetical protein
MEAIFSVYKVSEGGIGQREAIRLLREKKIKAERAYSPYIGQTGIKVMGTRRQIKRAESIIYG